MPFACPVLVHWSWSMQEMGKNQAEVFCRKARGLAYGSLSLRQAQSGMEVAIPCKSHEQWNVCVPSASHRIGIG
jgi:hypothetical protein